MKFRMAPKRGFVTPWQVLRGVYKSLDKRSDRDATGKKLNQGKKEEALLAKDDGSSRGKPSTQGVSRKTRSK